LKKLVYVLLSIVSIVATHSQTRSYSNEFLTIGVDAASLGKSNAVVASTGNVNSTYWNPAGLTQLKNKQASFMHASYFANIANYDFLAYALPLDDKSALGLDKNFSYGINAKIVRRIIGDFANSWGFGIDAGIQGKIKKYTYGVMVRDITTTFNSWQIDDDIFETAIEDPNNPLNRQEAPEKSEITLPSAQAGISRDFLFKGGDVTMNAEIDLNIRFAESNDLISTESLSIAPATGFELGYKKFVFLRGGFGNFQNIEQFDQSKKLTFQPNFGLGFQYKGISVDYALTDIGDQSISYYFFVDNYMCIY